MTAGHHKAPLPNFLEPGCLVKKNDGEISFYFGPDAQDKTVKPLLQLLLQYQMEGKEL